MTEQIKLPLDTVARGTKKVWVPPKEGHWIEVEVLEYNGEQFDLAWLVQLAGDGRADWPYHATPEIRRLMELGLVTNHKKPDSKYYDTGSWHPTLLLTEAMQEIGEF